VLNPGCTKPQTLGAISYNFSVEKTHLAHLMLKRILRLYVIFSICFLLLFGSCTSTEPKTFIAEKPLEIDSSEFRVIKREFGYEYKETSTVWLGGLMPKLPFVEVHSLDLKRKCMWRSKGMIMTCNSMVVKSHGTLVLIDTEEKFREIFAPIDSEQEAVSYVAYLTRTYPKYDIEKKLRYRTFISHFPSTYAKQVEDGYEVLLHDKKVFGCGPHPNFYSLFKVSKAGYINLLKTVKMFEDPKEDALCVD
jgi:hypothetical protein